ncbi:hypothetical protein [Massilia sp.]|uniref:hypothetical protein n=1 Tax=Massilia sp. TaxID=1882437 RepID=UPI002899A965|nr:hypothetical protein [Massilia sp.]
MGMHTQSVVDRETTRSEDAERLGARVVAWLIGQEIIESDISDCGLGTPAYPPGRHFMRACSATGTDGEDSGTCPDGVQLYTQRNGFANAQGTFGPARCPHCAAERDIDDYFAASQEWSEGGAGELACTGCGCEEPVPAWEHDDLLLGTLGLEFWNWPELSPGFLQELERLTGHRWSRMSGKV